MQLSLFEKSPSAAVLREEERFGLWDGKCGLPQRNIYSKGISGARLVAYERGHEKGRASWL